MHFIRTFVVSHFIHLTHTLDFGNKRIFYTDTSTCYFRLLEEDEDEQVKRNFLNAEMRRRVEESSVTYSLQIQLYDCKEGDTYSLYNPARAWNDQETPWHDLARIRLLSALPDDIVKATGFNIGNLPETVLAFPEPTSTSDFNVVPYIYKDIFQVSCVLY